MAQRKTTKKAAGSEKAAGSKKAAASKKPAAKETAGNKPGSKKAAQKKAARRKPDSNEPDSKQAAPTTPAATQSAPASSAQLAMMCLDCVDPAGLAAFWSAVLGWEVAATGEDYAMLTGPAHRLAFDRVEGYVAPGWPNEGGTKQFHFDLAVADIEAAATQCVSLGATRPDEQPGNGRWVVLLDPPGHPFCLTDEKNW